VAEVVPHFAHPALGATTTEMLAELDNKTI
jgi:hypothetical protein